MADGPKFEDTLPIDQAPPRFEDTLPVEAAVPRFEDTVPLEAPQFQMPLSPSQATASLIQSEVEGAPALKGALANVGDFAQGAAEGFQSGGRILGKYLAEKQVEFSDLTPKQKQVAKQNIQAGYEERFVIPDIQQPPTEARQLGRGFGAALEPGVTAATIVTSGLVNPLVSRGLSRLGIGMTQSGKAIAQAELAIAQDTLDKAAAQIAAKQLSKQALLETAQLNAVQGGIQSVGATTLSQMERGDNVPEALGKGLLSAPVGAILGGTLGAGLYKLSPTARAFKKAADLPDVTEATLLTPARQQMVDHLSRLKRQEVRLYKRLQRGLAEQPVDPALLPQIDAADANLQVAQMDLDRALEPTGPLSGTTAAQTNSLDEVGASYADILGQNLAKAESEYGRLLDQARFSKRPMTDAELQLINNKLSDNLNRQTIIQTELEGLSQRIPSVNAKLGGRNSAELSGVRQAVDLAIEQGNKVRALKDLEIFPADQLEALAQHEAENTLNFAGITRGPYAPRALGGAGLDNVHFAMVESATGTNVGKVALDAIKSRNIAGNAFDAEMQPVIGAISELNKMGYGLEDQWKILRYFESQGFNPAPVSRPSFHRTEWVGPPPTPEAMEHFQTLRQHLLQRAQQEVQAGILDPAQLIEGYVPIIMKSGIRQRGRSAATFLDPRFAQARETGMLIPDMHETDMLKIMQRRTRSGLAAQYQAPVVEQGIKEVVKLRMLGYNEAADDFSRYLKQTFHIDNEIPIEKLFGQSAEPLNQKVVAQLIEQGITDPDKLEQITDMINSSAYNSLTRVNLKNTLFQFIQPEATLLGEIGPVDYAVGRAKALLPATRKRFQKILNWSKRGEFPALAELGSEYKPRALSTLDKASRLTGLPQVFEKGEILNRYTAYAAAENRLRRLFKENGVVGLQQATTNLLPAEQDYVRRAFKSGGIESAIDAYAFIVDGRTNYFYDLASKGEWFRNGIGKHIPFTTFARNQISRYAEDLHAGNYKQFAQRVGGTLGAAWFMEKLSGYDLSDIKPGSSVKRLTDGYTPAPALTMAVKAGMKLADGDFKKAASDIVNLTPARLLKVQDNLKKHGNPFGFKPVPKDGMSRRLFGRPLFRGAK